VRITFGFGAHADIISASILTCQQWAVGASGALDVEYTKGGVPVILIPSPLLVGSGICEVGGATQANGIKSGLAATNAASASFKPMSAISLGFFLSFVFLELF
jgi:alpha-amylase